MSRILTTLAAAAALIAILAGTAFAVSATMGNDAVERGTADTWGNFTVVDTNNPAPFDGHFSEISFYAQRAGTIRFLVVDSAGTVAWTSDEITATGPGAHTVTLAAPAGVTAGSNLGVYSKGTGVVSFQYDPAADRAVWEANGAGLPTIGGALAVEPATEERARRLYSMRASITASSPEVCKNGGWETYGYRNQGQCIASVAANEQAGKG